MKKYYIFIAFISLLSIGVIFGHYAITKASVADQRAMDDLRQIKTAIGDSVQKKSKLPASINDLELEGDTKKRVSSYGYKVLTVETFELCANFQEKKKDQYDSSSYDSGGYDLPNAHEAGYQCFKLKETLPFAEEPEVDYTSSNKFSCDSPVKQVVTYDAVTVTYIDKAAFTISGTKDRLSGGYTLCTPLTVLDKNGATIKFSDIKNNDVVNLSGSSYSKISKIQKVNQ